MNNSILFFLIKLISSSFAFGPVCQCSHFQFELQSKWSMALVRYLSIFYCFLSVQLNYTHTSTLNSGSKFYHLGKIACHRNQSLDGHSNLHRLLNIRTSSGCVAVPFTPYHTTDNRKNPTKNFNIFAIIIQNCMLKKMNFPFKSSKKISANIIS